MKKYLLIIIGTAIVTATVFWLFSGGNVSDKSITMRYFDVSVGSNTSFACKALVAGHIFGDPIKGEAKAEVSEGTDEIALTVKDSETLVLTTAASVRAGIAEGDEMSILENDNNKLTAIWYQADVNAVISTIVLNKESGVAVWNKGNSDFLGAPFGSVIYLQCL